MKNSNRKEHQAKVLEDIENELNQGLINEKNEEESKFWKAVWWLGGVVIIFLFVTYIFASWPLSEIIKGSLEADDLEGNRIMAEEKEILFSSGAVEKLKELYFNYQTVEFSACLLGEKNGEQYDIGEVYEPKTYFQAFNSVRFEPCSTDTLIILHSHPYKSCLASDTDIEMLAQNKKENEEILMLVMCEPEAFAVYG